MKLFLINQMSACIQNDSRLISSSSSVMPYELSDVGNHSGESGTIFRQSKKFVSSTPSCYSTIAFSFFLLLVGLQFNFQYCFYLDLQFNFQYCFCFQKGVFITYQNLAQISYFPPFNYTDKLAFISSSYEDSFIRCSCVKNLLTFFNVATFQIFKAG